MTTGSALIAWGGATVRLPARAPCAAGEVRASKAVTNHDLPDSFRARFGVLTMADVFADVANTFEAAASSSSGFVFADHALARAALQRFYSLPAKMAPTTPAILIEVGPDLSKPPANDDGP